MDAQKLKVLLIIEQCNPEGSSVPLVGYRFYEQISRFATVKLVTHARNKPSLEKFHSDRDITYIPESNFIKQYYKVAERFSKLGNRIIWPLYNALTYPVYAEFNHTVFQKFKDAVMRGEYNLVHAITPMMPRYPVKMIQVCQNTPFILGPVNGGVPFPNGFREVARQEFAGFNFLRSVGRFIIPGYRETYEQADYILSGSTYTMGLIKDLFKIDNQKIDLFYENGIDTSFLQEVDDNSFITNKDITNLLFVGRLVPYKGADMLIEAIAQLQPTTQRKIKLTIVGDGSERTNLERLVKQHNLSDIIHFTGWIAQQETLNFYKNSDIFCFPSIREFGGAVVLEAMGNGLPCIVVNNGGIGEYVTPETGFSIDPLSRDFVVQELTKHIEHLSFDPTLRQEMSHQAIQRAKAFTWSAKGQVVRDLYQKLAATP